LGDNNRASDAVLIIGLGKFGSSTATALTRLGHEVLAVDDDPETVQEWSGTLTHVIEVDSTNLEAMRQVGADEFSMAVVAIGNDIEASILSTLVLEDLGVKEIWAKAITPAHGRILERIGADQVVYPERAMGERVAHLLTGKMIDFIEFDDGFAIAKTHAPLEAHGRSLGDVKLRSKYGITVIGVKSPGSDFVHAVPETVVHRGDLLIVSGRTDLVENFSAVT
jgi:trk system potassium uptake protein TrkA